MLQRLTVVAILSGAFFLFGCGGSEEAVQEEGMEGDQVVAEETAAEDQALTSFIGEKEPEEVAEPVQAEPAPEPAPEPVEVEPSAQPDAELDGLRTENTSLKQKVMQLEQDSQVLAARLSEAEAKLQAEADRAARAEDALKAAPAVQPTRATASGSYSEALNAFMTKRYDDAVDMFSGLLNRGVDPKLEDNCTYWIGESYYGKKMYAEAAAKFEAVLTYKVSEKKADAQFMLAQCFDRQGNKAAAKEAYEKVVKDYPMSGLVKRAKERWARL